MDTVSRWLKDLGVEFASFEEGFSNGYLFGQVLYRYGHQADFGQFSNKGSYAVMNLSKVQLSLEQLSIKFDPHRVMNKDPNYSKTLIERIHRALHSQSSPAAGKKKHSMSVQIEKSRIEVPGQKFEDFRTEQLKKIFEQEKEQKEKSFNRVLKERQKRIEVLKANKTFMMTWQGEGLENWKKNMKKKKERVLHERTVNMKLGNDKRNRVRASNEFYLGETNEGIKEFEKNMIRLGIDYVAETEKKVVKQDIAVEAAATMAKIKENKNKTVEAAKERDVRQRNSYIEQKKNEKFELFKKGSAQIGNVLLKILLKIYAKSFLSLQTLNKKLKRLSEVEKNVTHYKTLAEEKWKTIDKKRYEDLEAEQQAAKKEMVLKKKNFRKNILEAKLRSQDLHFDLIKPITHDLLILAEEVFSHLHQSPKIPGTLWKSWISVFTSKKPPSAEIKPKTQVKDPSDLAIYDESSNFLTHSYISGTENWGNLPTTYNLADILESIIDSTFPLSPPAPIPEGPNYLPLKLLILGPHFSGKKLQSKKLSETFGLKLFEMNKVLEDAKKVVLRKSEPEDTKKKKVVEEEPEIFVQAVLESNLDEELGKAKVFRARIRGVFGDQMKVEAEDLKKQGKKEEVKVQGFALVGYPNTLQEAVDLERQLSGFVHPSELPPEVRDLKKKEAEELVQYRPKGDVQVKLFGGVWDLVVWIELEEELAARRAAERRVDPAGNFYNLLYNPPADNILAKCKPVDWPGEEWLRQEYSNFNSNKPQLTHWFSMFGQKTQSSFLSIDGSQHPDSVFEIIKTRAQDVLNTKNTPIPTNETEFTGLDQPSAETLYNKWEDLKSTYMQKVSLAFAQFRGSIIELEKTLLQLKDQFLKVVKEGDNKQEAAQDFLFGFNDMIRTKSIFSKEEVEELNEKIEDVSDVLWDVVSQRKQKLDQLRDELIRSFEIEQQLTKVAKIAIGLFQAEGLKYTQSCNLVMAYKSILQHERYSEVVLSVPSDLAYPLEESLELIKLKILNTLTPSPSLCEEKELLEFRLKKITVWVQENIKKYRKLIQTVFLQLDSWIKEMVKLENQAINDFISTVRQAFKSKSVLNYQFPTNSSILKNLSI